MKRIAIISILLITIVSFNFGQSNSNLARNIVNKVDKLYRSESSYALMEMRIVTPHWERTLKMKTWSSGMDKTFIRIIAPKKEKGVGTLRIKNQMWNYLPKTNKVMKIPPSMMMANWMGSDFTNDDLVSEYTFIEDYNFSMTEINNPKPDLYYVKAVPKPDRPIVWGHIILAVDKETYIPVWEKYYDEKNKLMRMLKFRKVKDFGKKTIPSVMELIPQNKKGHKTVIKYLEADFNIPIDNSIFTLRNLRKE